LARHKDIYRPRNVAGFETEPTHKWSRSLQRCFGEVNRSADIGRNAIKQLPDTVSSKMHVAGLQPRGFFIWKIKPYAVNLGRSVRTCANEMRVYHTQSVGHFHGVSKLDGYILEGYKWQKPYPEEAHSPVINGYSICSNDRNLMSIFVRVQADHRTFCQQFFGESSTAKKQQSRDGEVEHISRRRSPDCKFG